MQIDLRTVSIKPLRQTFDNIAARLGGDKAASRYLEGMLDVQAAANFHYRPTWDPAHEIFDPTRTKIVMADWYSLKDPRQFYYGTYTGSRARMQEAAESDFEFVESRGLAANFDSGARQAALDFYVPLRHLAWGANMNNASMCAYGYGTAITQPCIYQSMDQLGVAQYLTKLGLTLGGPADLATGKRAWLEGAAWQQLRRITEDTFVIKDWFELFVAQNVVLDGIVFPLAYQVVDAELSKRAGPTVSLLTRFQVEWFADSSKWVDAVLKAVAAESPANKETLNGWIAAWAKRTVEAIKPLVHLAGLSEEAVATARDALKVRISKVGLSSKHPHPFQEIPMSNVFIAFQKNDDSRGIVEAILADNPTATVNEQPAMVRVDAPGRLTIRKNSVEEKLGRDFDLQELHVSLITLTGHIDETDEEFTLHWDH